MAIDYTMVSTDGAVVLKHPHSWKLSWCHTSNVDVKFPYFPNHRNFPVSTFPLLSFNVIQIVSLLSSLHVEEKKAGHGGAVSIHRSVQRGSFSAGDQVGDAAVRELQRTGREVECHSTVGLEGARESESEREA